MCGTYLNRARVIDTFVFVISSLLLLNAKTVFTLMNLDPEAVAYSQRYINYIFPNIWLFGQFDAIRRHLACFKMTYVPMIIMAVTTPLHILWCYIFTH